MRKAPLIVSALTLCGAGIMTAVAQTPATRPASPGVALPAAAVDSAPVVGPVLPGQKEQPLQPVVLADRPFESLSGGIALRYPVGSKAMREIERDDLVEFRDEARKWNLVVSRRTYPTPMMLTAARDGRGQMRPGILEQTAGAIIQQYSDPELLKKGLPGLKMLRQDLTNLGNSDVGMLVFRYTKDAERRFAQNAIIEANDQVFYVVSLTTPGRKEAEIPLTKDGDETSEDPGERQAVDTFRQILDSVTLLDRTAIHNDQVQRLFRTRTLLQNWTGKRLMETLIPERYERVLREDEGKFTDIGWRYIVEEPDRKGAQDEIKVGIHTLISENGSAKPTPKSQRTEREEWLSVSVDRKHEDWSRQTVLNDGTVPTPNNPWRKLVEFGTSDLKTSRFLLVNSHADPLNDPKAAEKRFMQGSNEDPKQPWVGNRDVYSLSVQYVGTAGNQDPVTRPLPVFYLPQALDSMLPRLLPPNEVKTYMLATYISDAREVMLRYVEVLPVQDVTLAGRKFQAIPVTDHIGLQGSPTTHYLTPTGQYLGSYTKDTRITILPTDRDTLVKIWPDANLRRPEEIGGAPVSAAQGPLDAPAPGRRGSITVGPSSPLDLNGPSRDGTSPGHGESILPDPLLPERPVRQPRAQDPK